MKTVSILCFCAIIAVPLTATEYYREKGPDPLITKVIKADDPAPLRRAEPAPVKTAGERSLVEHRPLDPMVSKLKWIRITENTVPDPPLPNPEDGRAWLKARMNTACKAIREQDPDMALRLAGEALRRLRTAEDEALAREFGPDFRRIAAAAGKEITTRKARAAFSELHLVLEGIIWDENEPVAIIKGRALKANDRQGNVRVVRIERESVELIYAFQQQEYRFYLEL